MHTLLDPYAQWQKNLTGLHFGSLINNVEAVTLRCLLIHYCHFHASR